VRITGLVFAVLALGLLAGCDRCGDWYSPFENPFKPGSHVCRDGAGQPQVPSGRNHRAAPRVGSFA